MIKFNRALKIVLDSAKKITSENVKLTDASGRVSSEDIYSDSNIPGFDNSAMDGFAVISSDTIGASKDAPMTLEVIGDIRAGDMPKKLLRHAQAIRIMTGAQSPKGADSVLMVEHVDKIQDRPKELIRVYREVSPGENIRKRAEDIRKGELIISRGTRLNPAHVGILASLGIQKIKVARRPRIAILATGDELVDLDERMGKGKVRNSNTYVLYSQIVKSGCIPENLGIVKDSSRRIEKKIRQGVGCDMILTSGGVSVGEYDLVRGVLKRMGADIKFWQVAIRPGKPLVFGKIGRTLVFGLPGNPVSGIVNFEMFVRPAILKMLGQKKDDRKEVYALSEEGLDKKKGLRYFLRARTHYKDGAYRTRLSGHQGSAMLKPMSLANSFIILEEGRGAVKKGIKVKVRFLDQE